MENPSEPGNTLCFFLFNSESVRRTPLNLGMVTLFFILTWEYIKTLSISLSDPMETPHLRAHPPQLTWFSAHAECVMEKTATQTMATA